MPLKKVTLSIGHLILLQNELDALLTEEIPLILKYDATQLVDAVNGKLKPYLKVKSELIMKRSEGAGTIPPIITKKGKKVLNPLYDAVVKELEVLEAKNVDLSINQVNFDLVATVKTVHNYPLLFKHFFYKS